MKENVKNNESGNAVKNAAKAEAKPQPVKETAKAEVENAAKTPEELQKEIQQHTEELQKCLQELQRKQKLSEHRTVFIHTLDQLASAEARLNEEEGFESNQVKVKFLDLSNYRDNEVFSIGNKSIILDFITFTREKIKSRIAEIEKQLVS